MNTFSQRLHQALASPGTGPIELAPDPLHIAMLNSDRPSMLRLVQQADDPAVAARRLQRLSEYQFLAGERPGANRTVHLVAWPFLADYGPQGGRVPTRFDIGAGCDPLLRKIEDLWRAMLKESTDAQLIPLRLGMHAHTLYGISPDQVQALVAGIGKSLRQPTTQMPSELTPGALLEPANSVGPVYAPVLLLAAVVGPENLEIEFAKDHPAIQAMSQIVAGKLALPTQVPQVRPLAPGRFYEALESTLVSETQAMASWKSGPQARARVELRLGQGSSQVLNRDVTLQFAHQSGEVRIQQAFDLRWLAVDKLRRAMSENPSQVDPAEEPVEDDGITDPDPSPLRRH
jgi:hypothetical protein